MDVTKDGDFLVYKETKVVEVKLTLDDLRQRKQGLLNEKEDLKRRSDEINLRIAETQGLIDKCKELKIQSAQEKMMAETIAQREAELAKMKADTNV
jgi:cell division septum initiation protein DivIVA